MTTSENWDDLAAVTALSDGVRRSAYQAVADGGPEPVGRDEVADTLGVGRTLAAFHLDKLVDAGLLEVSYARRTGRSGPGAGRPAKLYRVVPWEHSVSVPPRAYRDAAEMLAEAVDRSGADQALYEVAREQGRREPASDPAAALAVRGYSPVAGPDRIELRNCPFHRLAEEFPPLICGMNLALIDGMVAGSGWTARMDPAPGRCCVTLCKNKSD
ncbi:putative ArsR family transcriptional regulator [Actinoplanes campanulatus]|uniref:Putative ArsR family transcriptional regulator n=1 Tax=Actinoplanes campanulatus TaxID=113559 RepID=A0A7W5ABN2_9ACTN|nr:transcriptional regulator [Actinoplanes campanulatus]MBB3093035.1 putative ArsR family transcriptional regulator [Actinoplanes campanulatus]GGN00743.1 ArsR family transcriptional regulator [Actinoplanes campanulatus]GID33868.1 ArsR family transcriptional regulator [Actinoplanes campanulatus]